VQETELLFLQTSNFENILKLHNSAKSIFKTDINAIEYLDSISYELVRDVKGNLYNFPFNKSENEPFYLLLEVEKNASTDNKIEQLIQENESNIGNVMMSLTESQSESFWGIRESVVEAANKKGYVFKYDLSLPIEHF
jgi:FAD/FMN-containing dehydrogenase